MYNYFCMSKNKLVSNWTFCQLPMEKPNCTKVYLSLNFIKCCNEATVYRDCLYREGLVALGVSKTGCRSGEMLGEPT